MRLAFSLPILAAIGLAGATAVSWYWMNEDIPATLQGMLDKLPDNTLRVSYLNVPISAAIPLVGPARTSGYFMMARKEGGAPLQAPCEGITVDYQMSKAGAGNVALFIPPEQLAKVIACQ